VLCGNALKLYGLPPYREPAGATEASAA
jgi:hypothetical protein